jgi:hypothetical protein
MKQPAMPLTLAAAILCAVCASSATTPSETAPPSAPALESSPADSTTPDSTLPIGPEPVNLNPAGFTADITHPYGPVLAVGISGGAARGALVKLDKAAPKDGTGPLGKPNP